MKTGTILNRYSSAFVILVALALSGSAAALCLARGMGAQGTTSAQTQASPGWIVAASTIALLRRNGASEALITGAFDHPTTYVVVRPKIRNSLPNATAVQTFTSYASLQEAFAASTIAPTTKAILYDDEKWPFTPLEEQRDPVGYATKAADLVHRHGLLLIATPATNLATVDRPRPRNRYDAFLSLNILGGIAKVADILEVQAQGAQGTPRYAAFVQAASAQAHAANPAVKFYVGMSTNPTGRLVSPQQLFDDYQATKGYVAGYWLNVPGKSPYCPTCGTPHPEVALSFLQMLGR
ncbi:MAG: hypothetical protein M3Y13_10715 [Armatimonadota bacterium]|nr:hypothetical protein [Armatimonadota bacterium]